MRKELITTFMATGAVTAFFAATDTASATSTYTVKAGDSLSKIAVMYNTPVDKLKKINKLKGPYIYIGQKINIKSSKNTLKTTKKSTTTSPSHKTSSASATYTVKPGDSLNLIASKHGMSLQTLKSINGLSSDRIFVGQSLKTTGKTTKKIVVASPATKTVKKQKVSTSTYTVKAGDSLGLIASRTGISMSELKRINGLTSNLIHPNQTLKLKGKAQPVYASKTTTVSNKVSSTKTTTATSNAGGGILNLAMKQQGVPYVWGGSTPNGFDCSGFIYYVFKNNGYNIGRTSVAAYRAQAQSVSASSLRAGDIVFFQNTYKQGVSHAGIYIGGGQFIHAGSSGVQITNVQDSYWSKHFHSYGRL